MGDVRHIERQFTMEVSALREIVSYETGCAEFAERRLDVCFARMQFFRQGTGSEVALPAQERPPARRDRGTGCQTAEPLPFSGKATRRTGARLFGNRFHGHA